MSQRDLDGVPENRRRWTRAPVGGQMALSGAQAWDLIDAAASCDGGRWKEQGRWDSG